MRTFIDLLIGQEAMKFATRAYHETGNFINGEKFVLASQLQNQQYLFHQILRKVIAAILIEGKKLLRGIKSLQLCNFVTQK